MKCLVFVLCLVSSLVFGATSPLNPAVQKELTKIKQNSNPMVRLDFDARTATKAAAAVVYAKEAIPADSLVTDVKAYIDDVIVSANDNTVAVGCESATDLVGATDMTDFATNFVVQGTPTGATTNIVYSNGCTPYITVGAGASGITGGRAIIFIKYIPIESL